MTHGRKLRTGPLKVRRRAHQLTEAADTRIPDSCDVLVVGAGASGLLAAITAAEAGSSVVALDARTFAGRPILATGNGRCNFCNTNLTPDHYNHPEFAAAVMGEPNEALDRVLDFFRSCGLAWAKEDGRLYPLSRQAASVRNVLESRARRAGVTFACAREALDVAETSAAAPVGPVASAPAASAAPAGPAASVPATRWRVTYRERWQTGPDGPFESDSGCTRTLEARALVIATGGGAPLASSLKLPLVPFSPVLCSIAAVAPAPQLLERINGRRVRCLATLARAGRVVLREAGEVLFRPYGLSGIVCFNISRVCQPGDTVELDLAPEVDAWEVDHLVAGRPGDWHALDGILDPAIARQLLDLAGGPNSDGVAWRVAPLVKGLPFRVTGLADTDNAQVTRGGIDLSAIATHTLGIYGHEGLFACGEALDVDGACGGFNLAWAWLSGMRAGQSAANLMPAKKDTAAPTGD